MKRIVILVSVFAISAGIFVGTTVLSRSQKEQKAQKIRPFDMIYYLQVADANGNILKKERLLRQIHADGTYDVYGLGSDFPFTVKVRPDGITTTDVKSGQESFVPGNIAPITTDCAGAAQTTEGVRTMQLAGRDVFIVRKQGLPSALEYEEEGYAADTGCTPLWSAVRNADGVLTTFRAEQITFK